MGWEPYREPIATTLIRTIAIAAIVAAVIAWRTVIAWPIAFALVLWPSFGGHWIELGFLNGLRPRLPASRAVQVAARVIVWCLSGLAIGAGVLLTARAFPSTRALRLFAWWWPAPAFVAIELVAHVGLALRGRPNVYDGRG
jgi:hypothetical protein